MSPIPRLRAYSGPAMLSYGFRPFFLLGAAYAGLGILIWLPLLFGDITSHLRAGSGCRRAARGRRVRADHHGTAARCGGGLDRGVLDVRRRLRPVAVAAEKTGALTVGLIADRVAFRLGPF
jgi:hypothetical protein